MMRLGLGTALLAAMSAAAGPIWAVAAPEGRSSDRSVRGEPGYLGVSFRDVGEEQFALLRLKDTRGVEVILIDHDGPAFRAGLREHDVLLQMNGQAIENCDQFRKTLKDIPAGRMLAFVLSRGGQQQTLSAQLADRNKVGQEAWGRHITVPEPVTSDEPQWRSSKLLGGSSLAPDLAARGSGSPFLNASYTGVMLEVLNPQLADFFGATSGLLVREVDGNSPAAAAGMRAGDVVLKINAVAVLNPGDWVKTIYENRGRSVPVVVLRDRKETILTLTPDGKRRSKVVLLSPWPDAAETVGVLERMKLQ